MKELRREERHHATGSVDYISDEQDMIRTGLLSNLSDSGACIFTQENITSDNVTVYLNGLMDDPMKAEVMWCTEAIDNLYKVGIRFRN